MNICKESDYWNNWIGPEQFDNEYLEPIFNYKIKKLFLVSDNYNIEGILIYKKIFRIYVIKLLSKKSKSIIKGVGKMFINYFKKNFRGKIILSDDSNIPNYYSNLGFKKTNKYFYKWLLNDYNDDVYELYI